MDNDESYLGIYSHRTLWIVFGLTMALCIGLGFAFAPQEWSAFRIVVAGAAGGALSFLSVFVNHLLVW